ncbi:uncharacterized protein AMSG_02209 [Thecamonas trahens ATCC 50062]|uniref:Uncharacterized protein n=1 Tax=Thecamonas trahens ATCC 50062 TaxID=461836 RepID=A0A0L0DVA5_THETB|nr:hypothetical protein AMSG_02209 [Thecamonas trahens ATCC 50062]KNC56239.1 hypothetical protein AMSG_02209 [Thecamonas trahens ATCC 50062]|eukprot:XP_013760761.1 hypothetical protein AMSG_02209 [Thecamonas trahens ATCC 50062]
MSRPGMFDDTPGAHTMFGRDYLVTAAHGVAGPLTLCERCFWPPVLAAFGAEYKLEADAAAADAAVIDLPPVALPLFGPGVAFTLDAVWRVTPLASPPLSAPHWLADERPTARLLDGVWAALPGERGGGTNARRVRQLERGPDATPVLVGTHALIFLRNALDSVPYVTGAVRSRAFGWLADEWADASTGTRPFAMSGFGRWFKEHGAEHFTANHTRQQVYDRLVRYFVRRVVGGCKVWSRTGYSPETADDALFEWSELPRGGPPMLVSLRNALNAVPAVPDAASGRAFGWLGSGRDADVGGRAFDMSGFADWFAEDGRSYFPASYSCKQILACLKCYFAVRVYLSAALSFF